MAGTYTKLLHYFLGTQISWPDDGWYQVQTSDGSQTLCNGGSVCDVSPGDSLLDIYNDHFLNRDNRMSALHNFEKMISDSRPLIDTIEVEPPSENFEEVGGFTFGDINVDFEETER